MASHSEALDVLRGQVPERLYRFCEHLISSKNMDPSAAAEAVGAPGKAREIMRDSRTQRVLAAMLGSEREAYGELRKQAILTLRNLTLYDPAGAVDEQTNALKRIHDIPPEIRVAVKEIQFKPDGTTVIKFVDRLAALRLLLEHFGDIPIDANSAPGGVAAKIIFRGRGET